MSDGGNGRVRVIADRSARFYGRAMTAGRIYTVAGGGSGLGNGTPATSASLSPRELAVGRAVRATLSGPNGIEPYGADGGLAILDGGNDRVRTVTG